MHDPSDPNDPPPDLGLAVLLILAVFAALILTMILIGVAE